jgi:hypothetical protein
MMGQDLGSRLSTRSARVPHPTDVIPGDDDLTTVERPMTAGSNREGRCIRCGRYFLGAEAFDRHQRLRPSGVLCLDPRTVGLVIRERRGVMWWGQAGRWSGPDG